MMKKARQLATIVLVYSMFYPVLFAEPVFRYNGGEITSEEIETKNEQKFYEHRLKTFRLLVSEGEILLQQQLLKLEAEKLNTTPEKLLSQNTRTTPVTGQEIDELYQNVKGQYPDRSFDELKPHIVSHLEQQKKTQARNDYYKTLYEKYQVEIGIEEPVPPAVEIDIKNSAFHGPEDAAITIIEFSDLECPYCRMFRQEAIKVWSAYPGIKWVFKDFPLPFHQKAVKAHVAAYCAGEQNRFFKYQNKLFENELTKNDEWFEKKAAELNMNIKKFKTCLENPEPYQKKIDRNIEDGRKAGVSGTPAFFINGKIHSGTVSADELIQLIEKEKALLAK